MKKMKKGLIQLRCDVIKEILQNDKMRNMKNKFIKKPIISFIIIFGGVFAGIMGKGIDSYAADVEINDTNFPDEAFRKYISDEFDSYKNNILSEAEISKIFIVKVEDMGISSLKGIEYFTNMHTLYCSYNKLSNLDVSNNLSLKNLYCGNNLLTSLNISKNVNLKELDCTDNFLTELDVSKNTYLNTLVCQGNKLTELDISNNPQLFILCCTGNNISSVDVSNTHRLKAIYDMATANDTYYDYCNEKENEWVPIEYDDENNKIIYNKPSQMTDYDLVIPYNRTIEVGESFKINSYSSFCKIVSEPLYTATKFTAVSSNPGIISINSKKCIELTAVSPGKATITVTAKNGNITKSFDINVVEHIDEVSIDGNIFPDDNLRTALLDEEYDADGNGKLSYSEIKQITSLDVGNKDIENLSGIDKLEYIQYLRCGHNLLTSIDVGKNTMVKQISCDYNSLESIDVSSNKILENISVSHNPIVDVKLNKRIKKIDCYACKSIRNIDLTEFIYLETYNCGYCRLGTIDVSHNPRLKYLSCDTCNLTELNLSNNKKLERLICYQNLLSELDLSNNKNLKRIDCENNLLKSLDIEDKTELEYLKCSNNLIEKLDVRKNIKLNELDCTSNAIKELKLSNNLLLETLKCENNLLSSLDLSANTALKQLNCAENLFSEVDLSSQDLEKLSVGCYEAEYHQYNSEILNNWGLLLDKENKRLSFKEYIETPVSEVKSKETEITLAVGERKGINFEVIPSVSTCKAYNIKCYNAEMFEELGAISSSSGECGVHLKPKKVGTTKIVVVSHNGRKTITLTVNVVESIEMPTQEPTPTSKPSKEPAPTSQPTNGATPISQPTEGTQPSSQPTAQTSPTTTPSGEVSPSVAPTAVSNSVEMKDKVTAFSIKNKAKVKASAKIKIKDKDKIKKITLNGKTIKIKKNKTSFTLKLKSYKKKLKKKGKWNTLKVTDYKGNTKTIKFKTK